MSASGCVATSISPSAPHGSASASRAGRTRQPARASASALGVAIAIASAEARRPARRTARRSRRPPAPTTRSTVGMRVDDRERALADRSGRAENGDAFHQPVHRRIAASGRTRNRRGAANSQLSMRSSMPPWPGNQAPRVLHAGAPLQQRLEQIADDAERRRRVAPTQREHQRPVASGTPAARRAIIATVPNTSPPIAPSTRLLRADRRRQRPAAERPAGVGLRRVADDDDDQQQQHAPRGRADVADRRQRAERQADVDDRQRARGRVARAHRRAGRARTPTASAPDGDQRAVMQHDVGAHVRRRRPPRRPQARRAPETARGTRAPSAAAIAAYSTNASTATIERERPASRSAAGTRRCR